MSKKKKDVVNKIKLTKQEKKQYKALMNKAEEISLQFIQCQRIAISINSFLYGLGSSIFPKTQTQWNIFRNVFKLFLLYLGLKVLNPIIVALAYSLEISSSNYLSTLLI